MKKFIYSFMAIAFLMTVMPWQVSAVVEAEPTLYTEAEPVSVTEPAPIQKDILIKGSRDTVYWYAEDGKRYVFPNEKTYKTWFADYSLVNTISDERLQEIQLGGNVKYRPGSRLIKITTDPKVYAVGPNGYLHWISSEALAIELYGNDWADMVEDVPDAFFTNYNYGDDITTPFYVDGTLIQYSGVGNTYVIENGMKRQVRDQSTMSINTFQERFIIRSQEAMFYQNGELLFGSDSMYRDVAQLQQRWNGIIE